MFLALLLAAASVPTIGDCVPARWPSAEAQSLALLEKSPVNCLVVEAPSWKPAFLSAARQRGVMVLGDVSADPEALTAEALEAGVDAIYLEGNAPGEIVQKVEHAAKQAAKPVAWLPERMRMPIRWPEGGEAPSVVGTFQGLWAGVKLGHEGEAEAAPSGPPWIDTNSGFLRFARTVTPTSVPVWIANRPPADGHIPEERYIQAIGDAAMAGARWVVSFDANLAAKLIAGNGDAKKVWEHMNRVLQFYEKQRGLATLPDYSKLAIVQDVESGALVSGSVLDMVESKHVPAVVVPPSELGKAKLPELKMLLNIDPQALNPEQKDAVRDVARKGALTINGPPQWKLTLPPPTEMTFTDDQIKQLDEIWSEINRTLGRENFAVRLFGAPAMLSNLKANPEETTLVLHLVNYSDYPVQSITVHGLAKISKAKLLTPKGEKAVDLYDNDGGSGVDITEVEDVAILVMER